MWKFYPEATEREEEVGNWNWLEQCEENLLNSLKKVGIYVEKGK